MCRSSKTWRGTVKSDKSNTYDNLKRTPLYAIEQIPSSFCCKINELQEEHRKQSEKFSLSEEWNLETKVKTFPTAMKKVAEDTDHP